jgi:glycosyltransferase involved in cell wall biosynthesis
MGCLLPVIRNPHQLTTINVATNYSNGMLMKIVWLCPYPVSQLGDSLKWSIRRTSGHPCSWIVNLAKALARRGDVDLHLITLCPWVKDDQMVVHPDGYTVHVLKCGIPFLHRGFPAYAPLDALTGYRVERFKIVKKVKDLAPDIVHAHGTEYAYGLAAMDAGFPWLVTIQGIIADYLRTNPCRLYQLVAPLETRVFKAACFIGGRTRYDKGYAAKINPEATIFDLPEAMNECFFSEPWKNPEGQRIVFVGNCEQRKGLRRLIDALGIISGRFPKMALEAIGGGSPEQQAVLKAQAEACGVKLNFSGLKTAEEIAALHRECGLFVIPSENENSPNTLAEAMASGMPCVAFDTGGISSMLENEVSGLLVPFGDAKGMAEAVTRIFQSSEIRQQLGSNARKRAERNRPAHVAEVTVAAYRRIIEENSTTASLEG